MAWRVASCSLLIISEGVPDFIIISFNSIVWGSSVDSAVTGDTAVTWDTAVVGITGDTQCAI